MYNPLPPIIALCVLSVLSIPLFLLAIITTSLAVTTLLIRAVLVYIDLGLALISTYILPSTSSSTSSTFPTPLPHSKSHPQIPTLTPPTPSTPNVSHQRAFRHRRKSSASTTSNGSSNSPTPRRASSGIFGLGALGPLRDFEGVGGWRYTTSAEDARDDEVWLSLNSRLQLPALSPVTNAAGIGPGIGGAITGGVKGKSAGSSVVGGQSGKSSDRTRKKHRRSATGGSLPVRAGVSGNGIRPTTPEDIGMAPLVRDDQTPDELSMEEGFFGSSGKKAKNDDLRAAIMGGSGGSPNTGTFGSRGSSFHRSPSHFP